MPKAQRYRRLAREVRDRARVITDADAKRTMEEIASGYEALAIRYEALRRTDRQENPRISDDE